MIAADHSQCHIQHDKLHLYNSWLAGWMDGLFTQDTEYSKVKVMISFCLPACLPSCMHACKYIQGGGAHHQTHHCAHDEDHHASAPEDR